jgi:hypothetical protein
MKTILLTQEQFAIVDDDDYERLTKFKWWAALDRQTGKFYVRRHFGFRDNGNPIYRNMAVDVLGIKAGFQIDHRNLNPLDNRKENLRLATIQQNAWNRRRRNGATGYKGIHRLPNGRFRARIRLNRRPVSLGCFGTPMEAAKAYDEAALKHFGEFARTNGVAA